MLVEEVSMSGDFSMPHPSNSAKVIIKMHSSQSGLWQAQRTTVELHRDGAVEEYSIPPPQDVIERADFVYVKEQAVQNALAWVNSEDGPKTLSRVMQIDVQTEE